MLTAGAAGTEHVDPQICWVDLHRHFIRLHQNRYRNRRSVDASLGFRFRHTLHPVYAALIFQAGVSTLAQNGKADFLIAAQFRFIGAENFLFPALGLCIHGLHPVK